MPNHHGLDGFNKLADNNSTLEHNEREFIANYQTSMNRTLPQYSTRLQSNAHLISGIKYFNLLSPNLQSSYYGQCMGINNLIKLK